MYSVFLHIARLFNEQFSVYPLLYGSLGLEKRLSVDLNADDIDVLIPEKYIKSEWDNLIKLMNADGFRLINEHEHEFSNGTVTVAFAALESLTSFAAIKISAIPVVEDEGQKFLLLELSDYLKVYEASSKDGYRKNIKNKQDHIKISLIKRKHTEQIAESIKNSKLCFIKGDHCIASKNPADFNAAVLEFLKEE